MPPYDDSLTPVALADEAVAMSPSGETYAVKAVEQMGRVGPVDFGSAASGQNAEESGSSIIDLDDELEMDDNTLGQFWINPLSDVEIELRQTGQQEQRLVNSNQVGKITQRTPRPMRQVFVYEDDSAHAIVRNPKDWDMAKTLVYFTGYKLVLEDSPMSSADVRQMRGAPATIPTDSLKQNTVNKPGGGR